MWCAIVINFIVPLSSQLVKATLYKVLRKNSGGRDSSNYFCMLLFIYILFTNHVILFHFPISDDKSGDELLFVQRCNHVTYGGPTLGEHWSAMSCLLEN